MPKVRVGPKGKKSKAPSKPRTEKQERADFARLAKKYGSEALIKTAKEYGRFKAKTFMKGMRSDPVERARYIREHKKK